MNKRTELPTAENSSNFNRVAGATCQVGTTLENLKAAVCGETGASAKYAACAKLAKEKGYEQLGRLWEATSAAEQVHIRLEAGLVEELEPGYERPTADAPELEEIDLNLIASANGEIFETSDMYPGFIAKAQEEGNDKAVQVFTKAKLAEAVHAELYLQAYNNIDAADDDSYFLCPGCGYIEKGSAAGQGVQAVLSCRQTNRKGRPPGRPFSFYFPISNSTSPSSDSTRAARTRPASSSMKPTDAGNPPRGRLQLPGQMNRLAGYASRPARISGMWVCPCTHTCGSGSPGAMAREPLKPMRASLG